MPSVTIQYKDKMVLQFLKDIAQHLHFKIVNQKSEDKITNHINGVPFSPAKHPDVSVLFGIWENEKTTVEELRKAAWGDRI